MPLVAQTLATQLNNMNLTDSEATAIQNFVDAYGVYASTATGNGILISAAGVNLGKTVMSTVLTGMSEPNAGLTKIPQACSQFWITVCASFAVSFPTSIAATPPPFISLPVNFPLVCSDNTNNKKSKEECMLAIANTIHADTIIGGTVTLPGPLVGPII